MSLSHLTYYVMVILIVLEVLSGEQRAESRVAEGVGLIRAELEHVDDVSRSEGQASGHLQCSVSFFMVAERHNFKNIPGSLARRV